VKLIYEISANKKRDYILILPWGEHIPWIKWHLKS